MNSTETTHGKLIKSLPINISWKAGLFFLCPLLTLFGNLLVVISVITEKCLHNATNYFIVSLAVADICLAVLVMPLASLVEMYNGLWIYSQLFCDIFMMFDVLFCTASIMNLTAISMDRFVAVSHPLQYAKHNNTRRVQMTMAIVWILSFCISLPIACGLNHSNRSQFPAACEFLNADFIVYSSLGSFFLPTILMIWLYYRIFQVIRRQTSVIRIPKPKCHYNRHSNSSTMQINKNPSKVHDIILNKNSSTVLKNYNLINDQETCRYNDGNTCSITICPRSQSMEFKSPNNSNRPYKYIEITNRNVCNLENISVSESYKFPRSATDSFYLNKECVQKIITIKKDYFETFIELEYLKYSKCQIFYNPLENTKELNQIVSPYVSLSTASCEDADATNQFRKTSVIKNSKTIPCQCEFVEKSQMKNMKKINNLKFTFEKKLSPIIETIKIHKNYHKKLNMGKNDANSINDNTYQFVCQPFKKWRFQFICNCHFFKRYVKVKRNPERNSIRREKKVIKTLAIVLGAFLFCWMPFFLANMTNAICFKLDYYKNSVKSIFCPVPKTLMSICVWLGYINSFLNPVIYTVCNAEFRRIFKKILHLS